MRAVRYLAHPLYIQVVTIIVASLVVVSVTLLTYDHTKGRTNAVDRESNAAIRVTQLTSHVHAIRNYLNTVQVGQPLDLQSALAAHDETSALQHESSRLVTLTNVPGAYDLRLRANFLQNALQAFFRTPSRNSLDDVAISLEQLDNVVQPLQQQFVAAADDDQTALKDTAQSSRTIVVATVLIAAAVITALSVVIGRRLGAALAAATGERDRLSELTRAMNKRNEQFNALYQVVNEVTDSLSMRYVVRTTVEETARLVAADHVVLRLLEGDVLVPAGHYSDNPAYADTLGPLPLGTGISGRTAKRGKTNRIERDAYASMADDERIPGIESGVVVPLIVGARVLAPSPAGPAGPPTSMPTTNVSWS